jgi:hypothetical protein
MEDNPGQCTPQMRLLCQETLSGGVTREHVYTSNTPTACQFCSCNCSSMYARGEVCSTPRLPLLPGVSCCWSLLAPEAAAAAEDALNCWYGPLQKPALPTAAPGLLNPCAPPPQAPAAVCDAAAPAPDAPAAAQLSAAHGTAPLLVSFPGEDAAEPGKTSTSASPSGHPASPRVVRCTQSELLLRRCWPTPGTSCTYAPVPLLLLVPVPRDIGNDDRLAQPAALPRLLLWLPLSLAVLLVRPCCCATKPEAL